jgi:hypothetical protein
MHDEGMRNCKSVSYPACRIENRVQFSDSFQSRDAGSCFFIIVSFISMRLQADEPGQCSVAQLTACCPGNIEWCYVACLKQSEEACNISMEEAFQTYERLLWCKALATRCSSL